MRFSELFSQKATQMMINDTMYDLLTNKRET